MNSEKTEELKYLISKMTLEEKVGNLLYWSMAVPRLGIKPYNWWNEALHGVARAGNATIFPQTIALAATFDPELVRQEYDAISTEARAKYNEAQKRNDCGQYRGLTFWTPNINIFRDPRWGRGQETFGEDPYLTSTLAVEAVKGLQGEDPENLKVAACAKHFAVHSGPEATRHTANVEPSKKDLWETYLPAFKACVDAGVESVMGAYQRLYGEPCNGSRYLLKEILRDKWHFQGHVVSDCWAIQDFHQNHKVTKTAEESAALAINSGCDLNCGCTYHSAVAAVRQGLLSEETVDQSLLRLFTTREKLGMFDSWEKSKWGNLGAKDVDTEEHRALARKVAAESIVLLKNKNNLLPLKKEVKSIMIMGPSAANLNAMIGNYYGLNSRIVTILEGITAKTKDRPEFNIDYHMGVGMYGPSKQRGWTVGMAENADAVIACFGLDNMMEGEQGDSVESLEGDRSTIELPDWQKDYLQALHDRGTPVILVLTAGSPVAFPPDIADAVLYVWYSGEEGGNAIADVIFGDVNPSGHLPFTIPASTEDLPAFDDYSMKNRTYRFGEKEPLFPFGFGLSYTHWKIENACAEINDGKCTVKAEVTNTGKYKGKNVIQLYVSKEKPLEEDPKCSLKSFRKVDLQPGEKQELTFTLPLTAFETFNSEGESSVLPGKYAITVCDSAPVFSGLSVKKGASVPSQCFIEIKA